MKYENNHNEDHDYNIKFYHSIITIYYLRYVDLPLFSMSYDNIPGLMVCFSFQAHHGVSMIIHVLPGNGRRRNQAGAPAFNNCSNT